MSLCCSASCFRWFWLAYCFSSLAAARVSSIYVYSSDGFSGSNSLLVEFIDARTSLKGGYGSESAREGALRCPGRLLNPELVDVPPPRPPLVPLRSMMTGSRSESYAYSGSYS